MSLASLSAAALALPLAPGALAQEDGETNPVRIAQGVDIATFDPPDDTSSSSRAVFMNVFDLLVELDEDLQLAGGVAESWTSLDDLTWEFKLRPGIQFHNGTELTAKDVKFSFDVILDPNEGRRQAINMAFAGIQEVQAVDDYTVRIVTAEPYAPLPSMTGKVFIVPADAYQEMGREAFSLAPIGTGPFKVVEWVKDDHISLERFGDYWRGPAPVSHMEFRPIPEASTRVAALMAGELDLVSLVPPIEVPSIDAQDGISARMVRSLRTIYIGLKATEPPFDDVRVRLAMNYAVDVDAIIEFILDGHGFPLASVSGPSEFGFNPELVPYAYDPDMARQLLSEAGYEDGFTVSLHTPSGRYLQDVEVCQAIAGQLAEVGVTAEVRPAEFQQFYTDYLAGELDGMHLLGYASLLLDADGILGSTLEGGGAGSPYFSSPDADVLIKAGRQELDRDARLAIYHELMALLQNEAPWIFLYSQEDIYGAVDALAWTPKSDERLWGYTMSWQ